MYRALRNKLEFDHPYNKDLKHAISSNINKLFDKKAKGMFTIKMDELAITNRARWCNKTNDIVGFCYNHGHTLDYKFDSWSTLQDLKEKKNSGEIHLATEALFIALSDISISSTPKPVLILPICDHSSLFDVQRRAIIAIIETFEKENSEAKICSIGTDGDPSRRKLLNSLRKDNQNFPDLRFMNHFDANCLLGRIGINYDPKHLLKRFRGIFISDVKNIVFCKLPINKSHLRMILKDADSLLNPKDYQNVPAAVSLFEKLSNVDMNSSAFCGLFNEDILNEIYILNFLARNFLVYFTNPKINLEDQLIGLATFSITLLFIYRRNKTKFITADLYNDFQSTVQDAFITVSSFQSYDTDLAVLLFQLGTDDLEK